MVDGVVAGYGYFTSLYLQNVLHFSALRTGVALIPATVTVIDVDVPDAPSVGSSRSSSAAR
jgi:hypothetical protein